MIPARMMPFTAKTVHDLRETSGCGMMEIKRKLVLDQLDVEIEAFAKDGDPARLADILRTLAAKARGAF